MSKRIYRSVEVNEFTLKKLSKDLPAELTLGIDVGKSKMFGVLSSKDQILGIIRWDHLQWSRSLVDWLCGLGLSRCEAVMEPSGTYGDSLRHLLIGSGIPVYRVKPKQVHDARELYDGVPSSHDAKSAATIAWLHHLGRSELWESPKNRELKAAVRLMKMHRDSFQQAQNRLEAQLSRHWPEVLDLLELDSASLLELLGRFGSPAKIAKHSGEAGDLARQTGGHFLEEEKVQKVLRSAHQSLGAPMLEAEEQALLLLAQEARHQQLAWQKAKRWVQTLTADDAEAARLGQVVGSVTGCVLLAALGPLSRYTRPRQLLKASGLNLKERSSGKRQGQLAITKRGPGDVRQYLYLATLRWLRRDKVAGAWYKAKLARDGGRIKRRAIVALMRKLLVGLWWVAQGQPLDTSKLFDIRKLDIQTAA